jgi:hypothetical protein
MGKVGYLFLALMWTGVVFSAITGIISNPKYQVRRKDNSKEFRTAFWRFTGIVVVMTIASFVVMGA